MGCGGRWSRRGRASKPRTRKTCFFPTTCGSLPSPPRLHYVSGREGRGGEQRSIRRRNSARVKDWTDSSCMGKGKGETRDKNGGWGRGQRERRHGGPDSPGLRNLFVCGPAIAQYAWGGLTSLAGDLCRPDGLVCSLATWHRLSGPALRPKCLRQGEAGQAGAEKGEGATGREEGKKTRS